MGVLGSKELLSQVVVIYGYNSNDFPWRQIDNRSVYHTSGLIISCNEKKYVITTRSRLSSCNNIVMYHSYFGEKNPVMRNDMHIIFQSIEFNIVILVTNNRTELDLSKSELVSGEYDINAQRISHKIFNNTYIVPIKKSHYFTALMDMDLDSDTVNYRVNIYDAKFLKAFVYEKTYLPPNYMYKFKLIMNNTSSLYGVCGAIIFNKKHKPIGMVSKSVSKTLFVLPTRAIVKIITDFVSYIDKPNEYHGLLTLPINLKCNKKLEAQVNDQITINTTNDQIILKQTDKVVSVNDKDIIIIKNEIMVYDIDYKNHIPINIYLRQNLKYGIPMKIVIDRNHKLTEYSVYGTAYNDIYFPLSNQQSFLPKYLVPFININGVIIVELTHELLDITMLNKIVLNNDIVNSLFNGELTKAAKYLLIIDCLDADVAKKYNLPQIIYNKKQTLKCPSVTVVNNKLVSSIDDINNIISTSNSNNYTLLITANGVINEIIV